MNAYVRDRQSERWERKRQCLESTDPRCVICVFTAVPALCRPNGSRSTIWCRSCIARSRTYTRSALDRRRARLADAGYTESICIICEEHDIRTIELAHIAARANGPWIVPLCANCHAIHSDAEQDELGDLRLADPARRPLVRQAAFQLGLALILGALAASTTRDGSESLQTFYALAAAILAAWAAWDLTADRHFVERFGPDYCAGVPTRDP